VTATTTPWAWYSDADLLRREQERIFRSAWQYVGHADQVAERGSYFTARVGHVPVVVTRDREGVLNGFVNVCRHRGFAVARGAGRRETLQCGYHAWTYDLDGSLRAAPRSERDPEFDAGELSLVRVQIATWGPFVFANADPDAPPLERTLRDLPELVAAAGVDVDSLRFRLRSEFSVEANWKLVCENFLECYHCPVAHPGFSGMVDVSPDAYRLEAGETFSSQVGLLRANGTKRYDPTGEVPHSQFHFIWPNTGINILPGRANLSIGPMLPLTPSRTERFLDYFFAADADDAWVEDLLAFDDQVGREDRALVEVVQQGVAAGMIERGRLLPDTEVLVADFQRRVAEALA
jgi:phenylpropionate dioxygenase-like ring-hydroxylating dioxygenase large terminal subunit